MKLSRRAMALATATAILAPLSGPASAKTLDLAKPADAMTAWRKIQCSTTDAKPTLYHWSGRLYGQVPGERARHLFNLEGYNVRQCVTVTDPQKGTGVRMVTKEIMLYLDPKSNEVVRTWKNPWTGKDNEIFHVANDPVNQPPSYSAGLFGIREDGGKYFWNIEVPLFYPSPLGGDYQKYVGGEYQAVEMFNFMMDKKDLLDAKKAEAWSTTVSWVRIAQWLPFMEMGSRPGIMFANATGAKIATFEELPAVLKDEVRKNYPGYDTPPPADDARKNATTWTEYKKFLDAKMAGKPKAESGGH
jgi:hypothetical protein